MAMRPPLTHRSPRDRRVWKQVRERVDSTGSELLRKKRRGAHPSWFLASRLAPLCRSTTQIVSLPCAAALCRGVFLVDGRVQRAPLRRTSRAPSQLRWECAMDVHNQRKIVGQQLQQSFQNSSSRFQSSKYRPNHLFFSFDCTSIDRVSVTVIPKRHW